MTLLEAAACGCAIVSTKNCAIPEFFNHRKDAFLSNDMVELRAYISQLFKDPDLAKEMGLEARNTVLEKCGITRFCNEWNKVFEQVSNFTFKG